MAIERNTRKEKPTNDLPESKKSIVMDTASQTGPVKFIAFPHPDVPTIQTIEDRVDIVAALDSIDGRRAEIIKIHTGLDNGKEATFDEIADDKDISRERVQQIYHRGISDLIKGNKLGLQDDEPKELHPQPKPVEVWQKITAMKKDKITNEEIGERLHIPPYAIDNYKKST